MDEVFGLKSWNVITHIDMFISQQNKRFGTIFLKQLHHFITWIEIMEGMVNHTLPDRLVNHIHKTSRSISDTSFKYKDSVTILHDNDFWNWICKPEGWKEIGTL